MVKKSKKIVPKEETQPEKSEEDYSLASEAVEKAIHEIYGINPSNQGPYKPGESIDGFMERLDTLRLYSGYVLFDKSVLEREREQLSKDKKRLKRMCDELSNKLTRNEEDSLDLEDEIDEPYDDGGD